MKKLMVLSVFAVMFLLSSQASASVNWDSYLMTGGKISDGYNSETDETFHSVYCDVSTGVSPLERCGRVTAWDSGSSWDAGASIYTTGGTTWTAAFMPEGSWQTYNSYNSFVGRFTAEENTINFYHSYDYDLNIWAATEEPIDYAYAGAYASITVINKSKGQVIFDEKIFNDNLISRGTPDQTSRSYTSAVYSASVTQNDEIYVVYDVVASGETRPKSIIDSNISSEIYFSTSNTVAPEPVSSILFVAGGITLGLRRLRKKIVYS